MWRNFRLTVSVQTEFSSDEETYEISTEYESEIKDENFPIDVFSKNS